MTTRNPLERAAGIAAECTTMLRGLRGAASKRELVARMDGFTKFADGNGVCRQIREHFVGAFREQAAQFGADQKPSIDLSKRITGDRE